MVGIVVVAHGELAQELLRTTAMIVNQLVPATIAVAITGEEEADEIRQRIQTAIDQVDDGDGVIVFTDMFGGSPSNIALSFLNEGQVEIISGVSLPMLVDMFHSRDGRSLAELAEQLAETGRSSIRLASQYLRGRS